MRSLPLPPPPVARSRAVAAAGVLGLAILGGVLVLVVPKFAEVFRQVKVAMPESTLAVISLSEVLISHGWAAPLSLLAVYDFLSRLSPGQDKIARVVVPIVVVVLLGWMLFALFHPLLGICHGGIGPKR